MAKKMANRFVHNVTSPVWYPWIMLDRELPAMAACPKCRTIVRMAVTGVVAFVSYALLSAMAWGVVHFLRGCPVYEGPSFGMMVERVRIAETNRFSDSNGCDVAIFKADCEMPVPANGKDMLVRGVGELFADLNLMTFAGRKTISHNIEDVAGGIEWARANFFSRADALKGERRLEGGGCSWTELVAEMSLEGRVVWSNEQYLSYRIRCCSYWGGAHPDVQVICGVLDRKTGRRILPEDFIREECLGKVLNELRRSIAKENPDSDVLRELATPDDRPYEEVLRTWQEEQSFYLKGSVGIAPALTDNFFFDANGVTWVFMEYQISGYADGCPSGTVSWNLVERCATSDFKH